MRREIISENSFYKQLNKLDQFVHQRSIEEVHHNTFSEFAPFLYDELGIRIGGIMIYDIKNRNYHLYENPTFDEKENFYPRIPFQIDDGKYSDLIDLAFIGNRHPKYLPHANAHPEFHKIFSGEIPKGDYKDEALFPFPKQKGDFIFKQKEYYRSASEILFFLYSWRYLVRLLSKFNLDENIQTFDDFYFANFSKPKCEEEIWFETTTGFNIGQLYNDFEQQVNDKTREAYISYYKYEFKPDNDSSFIEIEWSKLGLHFENEAGIHSLLSLLDYASRVSGISGPAEFSKDRRKLRAEIKNYYELISTKQFDKVTKEAIHKALSKVIYFAFSKTNDNLNNLFQHEFLSRIKFPVLPYFLEIFFDDANSESGNHRKHSPKQHFVFPIWYSDFNLTSKEDFNQQSFVAYCLLSIEPAWSFLNNYEYFNDEKVEERNIQRIKTVFQLINKRLIEKGYYQKIVQRDILNHATKAAISQVMARNMSHNIGSHVIPYLINNLEKFNSAKQETYHRYIQERMELIATVGTTFPSYLKTEITITELIEEFKENDIVKEGIVDGSIKEIFWNVNDANSSFHLPGGQIGRQVFFSLLEGIIRNCKKHSKPEINREQPTIPLLFKINKCSNPLFEKDYFELHILDNLGKQNEGDRKTSTLRKIREYLFKPVLENGELRKGGWGIIELKIAAALLVDVPLHSIDQFSNGSDLQEIEDVKYPPVLDVSFYAVPNKNDKENNSVAQVNDDGSEGKNLGYKMYVRKPKFLFITNENFRNEVKRHINADTIVDTSAFSMMEVCDFFISESDFNRLSNYRNISLPIAKKLFDETLAKDRYLTLLWEYWLKEKYLEFVNSELVFPDKNLSGENYKDKILFDSHGDWLKNNFSESIKDFKPLFYQIFNAKSSLISIKEKLLVDAITKNKMLESIAVGVSILDERIQEEASSKGHEDLQKNNKLSSIKLIELFDLMKIYIPKKSDFNLQNDFIDGKGEGIRNKINILDFDTHPLIELVINRFETDKYVLIHHTIFEIICFNIYQSKSQKTLNILYQRIYSECKFQDRHLILISGLGLPSNLPNACYFLNLVTIQNIILVMKSKFHLVQALQSLRPITIKKWKNENSHLL